MFVPMKPAMKYLPTLDLWDNVTQTAIQTGQILIQCGQWVRCGDGPKSRVVCVKNTGSIWAVHPEAGKVSMPRFLERVHAWNRKPISSVNLKKA